MLYSSTFLGQIRDRAMDLYQNSNVMPPLHIKQAMAEAGIPEDDFWETRQAIKKLGLVENSKQQKKPTRRRRLVKQLCISFIPGLPLDKKSIAAGER
ncbi:MAG: hypothetical protein RL292_574 [Candidatus Parcubacteria bacterium]|jgi:hypothetical protein